MSKIEPCECGQPIQSVQWAEGWGQSSPPVVCDACYRAGPIGDTEAEAITLWNAERRKARGEGA